MLERSGRAAVPPKIHYTIQEDVLQDQLLQKRVSQGCAAVGQWLAPKHLEAYPYLVIKVAIEDWTDEAQPILAPASLLPVHELLGLGTEDGSAHLEGGP